MKPVLADTNKARFHATVPDFVAVANSIIENAILIRTVLTKFDRR